MEQVICQVNSSAAILRQELADVLMKLDSPVAANRLECRTKITKLRETVPGNLNKAASFLRNNTPSKTRAPATQVYGSASPKTQFEPLQKTSTTPTSSNTTVGEPLVKPTATPVNANTCTPTASTLMSSSTRVKSTPVAKKLFEPKNAPRNPPSFSSANTDSDFTDAEGLSAAEAQLDIQVQSPQQDENNAEKKKARRMKRQKQASMPRQNKTSMRGWISRNKNTKKVKKSM